MTSALPHGASRGRSRDTKAWLLLLLALVPVFAGAAFAFRERQVRNAANAEVMRSEQVIEHVHQMHLGLAGYRNAQLRLAIAASDLRTDGRIADAERARQEAVTALRSAKSSVAPMFEIVLAQREVQGSFDVAAAITGLLDQMAGAMEAEIPGQPPGPAIQALDPVVKQSFPPNWAPSETLQGPAAPSVARLYGDLLQWWVIWSDDFTPVILASTGPEIASSYEAALASPLREAATWQVASEQIFAIADGASDTSPFGDFSLDPSLKAADDIGVWLNERSNTASTTDRPALNRRAAWVDELLAISDAALVYIDDTQASYQELSAARIDDLRRERSIGVAGLAVASLLGLALFALTRSEIRRRRRVERAHAEALAELDEKATRDPVTGLFNRRRLEAKLQDLLQMIGPGKELTLIYVDLDEFKGINDIWGHAAGDLVLVEVARRLESLDLGGLESEAVRMGGDEFVVNVWGPRAAARAKVNAEHVLQVVRQPIRLPEDVVELQATAGVSIANKASTVDSLLLDADTALLLAKQQRRGAAAVHDPSNSRAGMLLTKLPNALRDGEIYCDVQPIWDVDAGQVVHLEALARWKMPSGEQISPGEFVPIIEAFGLTHRLRRTVLKHIAEAQSRLDAVIWINVSPVEFAMNRFAESFKQDIDELGVDPRRLGVEVTESAAVANSERFGNQLRALRDLGITIALDDFGSGYSALGFLRDLPVDVVKIDRSIISEIDSDPINQDLVHSIMTICQHLDVEVLAEGVELDSELAWLSAAGIRLVQGYLLGRPTSVDAALNLAVLPPPRVSVHR